MSEIVRLFVQPLIAVTLQAADQGDTTTILETLAESAENLAVLIEREVEKAPDAEPQVSLTPMAEIVADKGYHSSETVLAVQQAEARSYIPEPKRARRKWAGKAAEQHAVYANRQRVKGIYGKRLMKKRGELIERSFAHCYETGAMRRVYLRGRETVWKRQLIHVGAFNLSLIFRQKLGAGHRGNSATIKLRPFLSFCHSGSHCKRLQTSQARFSELQNAKPKLSVISAPAIPAIKFRGFRHRLLSLVCQVVRFY